MGEDVQDSGAPDNMGDPLQGEVTLVNSGRAPLPQSPDAAGNVLTVPAVSPKEEDDLKAMRDKALRALAGRGDRANSDPIPLLGDPEDLEFNLVFADVGSEVQDYFRDALGQTVQETRAEYTDDDGKVVLTGHPQVQSPDGIVTGQRITFWRGQDKMDVESDQTDTNRTRLIIYPEEQRKKSQEQSGQTP